MTRIRFLYNAAVLADTMAERGEKTMKKEEKKPVDWEVKDPKPPVIQSGHMENRKQER